MIERHSGRSVPASRSHHQETSPLSKLPSSKSKKLRQEIIDTCLEMNASGLNQGTSGNVSARVRGGMLITPSGRPYKTMKPRDIVYMLDDGSYQGDLVPSTEWRFHLDILATRPDVHAIVHAHPTFCTTLAILKKDIPPLHYMVAVAGGADIRCADYATFGTRELSDNALKALKDRKACLLAHHGMIATGPDLAKALWLANEVETLARQYYYTLQAGGPPLLAKAEIKNVMQRIHSYGPRSDADGDDSTKPRPAGQRPVA
jgi:L-fuculose-phosphate aldolase